MAETVRDTIKRVVHKHLTEEKGLAFGQCLTAVGWVGGTLPELYEEDGMVELSMADVAGGGIVVGSALAGRRPFYIIRYQGFNWYNSPMIVNYACKSKELWKRPCPLFVRSIAMEGSIGPVAGSSHHSLYYRMPGVKIISPMTPKEYEYTYEQFMKDDDVYYVSEHRKSYDSAKEFANIMYPKADITLFPISITRFAAEEARLKLQEVGVKANIIHLLWLKPFNLEDKWIAALNHSKAGGLVLDDDYEDGVSKCIAHDLMMHSNKKVQVMGLKPRTAGFHKGVDNLPPTCDQIVERVLKELS